MRDTVHVSIGEVKIARGSSILMASLGSCVGIGFLWKQRGIYGLAHCLLPEAPAPGFEITARFVSQALPSLLALMKIRGDDRREISVVLAGGGNMTAPGDAPLSRLVGQQNLNAAEKYLKESGLHVIHRDTGGESGKKILIYCETGEYRVTAIPRIAA